MIHSFLHILRNFNNHPDVAGYLRKKYQWPSEPTIFDGGSIAVKDVRSFFSYTSKKPLDNLDIILVIKSCELINAEVANTMLKILEEPPPYLYIHLITNNESQVISTIVSRTHRIRHDLASASVDVDWQWGKMSLRERLNWAKDLAENSEISEKLVKWLELEKANKNWLAAREIEKLLNKISKTNSNIRLLLENFALRDKIRAK